MAELAKEILPVNIEDELKQSYLDYAMSVIIGRALPDVRDGLKPVHRRVLYAMHELSNDWNKPPKKSARVVGEVIGKYHPHGDSAVYDSIVRMAQNFSMRYPLINGQGNFGSVDGDSAAAMRYTEIRMERLAHSLLADLEKETVDFVLNYDETEKIPVVLPTRVPNLLVNGSSGIAVGMATNIPPHNLTEVINGCLALVEDPEITVEQLMQYIPGPDFPTSAEISGVAGIVSAYKTGRGRIYVRAVTEIETDEGNGRQAIIVKELPYQVNKARMIEKIAELVKLKKLEGISGLRDESDKDGIRVVIELKRGEVAEVVLNNLYNLTQMQNVFGINMVALVDGQPRVLSLKSILNLFLSHRREVVTRRTVFELRKAKERAHILEGLAVALANIDPIIAIIKAAKTPQDAKQSLLQKNWGAGPIIALLGKTELDVTRPDDLEDLYGINGENYRLSPAQAQAILDLRLHRLTGLEQDKIFDEYRGLLTSIREFVEILSDVQRLMAVVKQELEEIKEQFGDARRTKIMSSHQDLSEADLISEEDVVVTLSNGGYIKYQPLTLYQSQRRGGRGKAAAQVKEEDAIYRLIVANTHDTVMCFSSRGKVYWLKVYQLPQAGRTSKGRPIINLLPLEENEKINTILPMREISEHQFIMMATQNGTIKKVAATEFMRPRSSGLIAVDLRENDKLIGVATTNGNDDVMLFSDIGKVVRFNESDIRAMGRTACGVRGIKLQSGQNVISMIVVNGEGDILTATENGYGKRTSLSEYPLRGRGGQGVISIQTTERNGLAVGAIQVANGDEVMLISNKGVLVRIPSAEISVVGRNTQGVRLINLAESEHLVGLQRIEEIKDEEIKDEEQQEE